ncbi:MAG: hypothetical protein A2784_04155 [Candidatus Chisholmbacteria bacterium RIFCSPHIGHO2_01_FULL_48_12]|uniref:Erythromycin biosynthesis sensory transduction protein eryC1 n=2 Tax=Patescibacteria group TaxID=1783273 RepID=A0A1G1VNN0_9BACT|nr:MAG: hypothetical protein A2784_04155 [Candidatus Chisholmbacteria bacterium RIFCSPHIGHO2_01_FULL_48_12]OGZ40459.1 MAG: hypothetical protein A3I20_01705 [Candidatus Portnoybacteria bacterium RIFCSPLOWO2_02_FULL_40_15]
MPVSFVDLIRQNQLHRAEYTRAINQVVKSADFILGKPVEQFESAFAKFCGTKYCISLNSGTDALEFALRAVNIGPKDEVITAPNSYFSSAMVITKIGATPVFADIDPQTYTLNATKVAQAITSRTRAIIPVHLCGQSADMDPLINLAQKYKLTIIEDCCQAHGAKYKGKTVPITGLGAFSFYPGKNLGSFGDGGALVTNSLRIATMVQQLRNDGSLKKYHHQIIGSKSRLDTIQASILNIKLKYLRSWNTQRQRHARLYQQLLKHIPQIKIHSQAEYAYHIYHLFMIEVPHRDKLQQYLSSKGISTVIHYPIPIHLQPAYKNLGYHRGDFPVTEAAAKHILSLPMFPELKTSEIRYVASTIHEFYSR